MPVAPQWGGLSFKLSVSDGAKHKDKQKVQNSVRDVTIANDILYVADEAGDAVRMYDPATGVPLGFASIASPVHLAVFENQLYAGSGNSVYSGALVSPPGALPQVPSPTWFEGQTVPPFPPPPDGYTNSVTLTLKNLNLNLPPGSPVSGITFDDSGNMYVALRAARAIYKFASASGRGKQTFAGAQAAFISGLPDDPEFVLWVSDKSSAG
jgi:hypothetical protein